MVNNETQGRSIWRVLVCGAGTQQDFVNMRRFSIWCVAWAAAQIAASWVLNSYAVTGVAAWMIALAPSIVAIGALVSYLRYLRLADELQRRIQIEGLAVGFGAAWIFVIGYQSFEHAGAPELTVVATILVMTAALIVGQLLAVRHYR